MGESYQPSRYALSLPAMQELHRQADECIALAESYEMQKRLLGIQFGAELKQLPAFITRIKNIIKASDALPGIKESAYSLAFQVTGKSTSSKKPQETAEAADGTKKETATHHKQSHSVDSILENFGRFISYLETIPQYTPNIQDITIAALNSKHAALSSTHLNLKDLERNLSLARSRRDELLYTETTGLVEIAYAVKSEIKGIFGSSSTQYKLISKHKFSKFKK